MLDNLNVQPGHRILEADDLVDRDAHATPPPRSAATVGAQLTRRGDAQRERAAQYPRHERARNLVRCDSATAGGWRYWEDWFPIAGGGCWSRPTALTRARSPLKFGLRRSARQDRCAANDAQPGPSLLRTSTV